MRTPGRAYLPLILRLVVNLVSFRKLLDEAAEQRHFTVIGVMGPGRYSLGYQAGGKGVYLGELDLRQSFTDDGSNGEMVDALARAIGKALNSSPAANLAVSKIAPRISIVEPEIEP